jgi:FkbM family methyltransferase
MSNIIGLRAIHECEKVPRQFGRPTIANFIRYNRIADMQWQSRLICALSASVSKSHVSLQKMSTETALKSIVKKSGLYPLARHVYRRFNPALRQERAALKRFYAQFVKPNDLCFDIGANVGQTTEALLELGARIIAVEPNPLCYPVLNWQFGRNPRVTLVRKAVGAATGSAVLNYHGTDSTASILTDWPFENTSTQAVELTTLDELIHQFGRPRLCKVDVEGYEVEVFQGLTQPIPVIDFEIHPGILRWAREVLHRLSTIGQITGANTASQHHAGWIFPDWLPLDEFLRKLETKPEGMEDAVIKMSDAAETKQAA